MRNMEEPLYCWEPLDESSKWDRYDSFEITSEKDGFRLINLNVSLVMKPKMPGDLMNITSSQQKIRIMIPNLLAGGLRISCIGY